MFIPLHISSASPSLTRYRTELPLKGGANTRAMYIRSRSPYEPRHYSRTLQRVKLGDALKIRKRRVLSWTATVQALNTHMLKSWKSWGRQALSCLFVASLIGEYTWKVACSLLVDEYFGSFLFKIGDVMDEERLTFQIVKHVYEYE